MSGEPAGFELRDVVEFRERSGNIKSRPYHAKIVGVNMDHTQFLLRRGGSTADIWKPAKELTLVRRGSKAILVGQPVSWDSCPEQTLTGTVLGITHAGRWIHVGLDPEGEVVLVEACRIKPRSEP